MDEAPENTGTIEERIASLKAEHKACSDQVYGLESQLRDAKSRRDRIEDAMRAIVGLPADARAGYGQAAGLSDLQRQLSGRVLGVERVPISGGGAY